MSDNVIALPGFNAPSTDPVAKVVEILEEALAEARAGKCIAVAIATVTRDPLTAVHTFHGEHTSRHSLAAAVMGLNWAMGQAMGVGDE